jgi:hypothetical protein
MPKKNKKTLANLPNYTYGCEIECFGGEGVGFAELRKAFRKAGLSIRHEDDSGEDYNSRTWVVGDDGSLHHVCPLEGMEIKSPILKGQQGLKTIQKVCRILKSLKFEVNSTCGLHIHVGIINAKKKFKAEELIEILKRYHRHSDKINLLVDINRRRNQYCRNLDDVLDNIEACDLRDEDFDLSDLQEFGEHCDAVNIEALDYHGTIEFRQHQGTINAKEITNWIKFCLTHVEMSRKLLKMKKQAIDEAEAKVAKLDRLFAGHTSSVRKHFLSQAKRINGSKFKPAVLLAA